MSTKAGSLSWRWNATPKWSVSVSGRVTRTEVDFMSVNVGDSIECWSLMVLDCNSFAAFVVITRYNATNSPTKEFPAVSRRWTLNKVNQCLFVDCVISRQILLFWYNVRYCNTFLRLIMSILKAPLKLRPFGAIQICLLLLLLISSGNFFEKRLRVGELGL